MTRHKLQTMIKRHDERAAGNKQGRKAARKEREKT